MIYVNTVSGAVRECDPESALGVRLESDARWKAADDDAIDDLLASADVDPDADVVTQMQHAIAARDTADESDED